MHHVLTGWKEISASLGVSVRTAHRLRLTAGLPVANMTPRTVFAERERVSAWLAERGRTEVLRAEPASAMVQT